MWKVIIIIVLVIIGYIGLRVWRRRSRRRDFLRKQQEEIRRSKIEHEQEKIKNTPKEKLLKKFNRRFKRR